MYQQTQMNDVFLREWQSYRNKVRIIKILIWFLCFIPLILGFLVAVFGKQNSAEPKLDGWVGFMWCLIGSITMLFYLAPTCIAICRSHASVGMVFWLNILLGLGAIGYIPILIWSIMGYSFQKKYLSGMVSPGVGNINNYNSAGNPTQMPPQGYPQQCSTVSQRQASVQDCYPASPEQVVTPIPYNQGSKEQSEPVCVKPLTVNTEKEQSAIEKLLCSAELGDAKAQFVLGCYYTEGKMVEKDDQKAVEWLLKAAEQNHINSQCLLGIRYMSGNGVIKDIDEAIKWLTMAANQGNEHARNMLNTIQNDAVDVSIPT